MYSLLLAGNKKQPDVDEKFLSYLRARVESLSSFSEVIILSNTSIKIQIENKIVKIKEIPSSTSGALATAAYGLSFLPEDEPFIIVPSNAEVLRGNIEVFQREMLERSPVVGAIVFNGNDPLFSYARLGKSGEIIEIVEKKVSGSCALAGVYYFANKVEFSKCLEWAMVNNIQNNGSFFISPALNYFLAKSLQITLFEIPAEDYLRY
jgi:hypothetical protein